MCTETGMWASRASVADSGNHSLPGRSKGSCEDSIHRVRTQRWPRCLQGHCPACQEKQKGEATCSTQNIKKKNHRTSEPERNFFLQMGRLRLRARKGSVKATQEGRKQNLAAPWAQLPALGFGQPWRCPKLPRPWEGLEKGSSSDQPHSIMQEVSLCSEGGPPARKASRIPGAAQERKGGHLARSPWKDRWEPGQGTSPAAPSETYLQRPKVASRRLYRADQEAPSSHLLGGNWTLPH